MGKKWVIAVISTSKDLKAIRQEVITYLKDNSVDVSAFEESNFPVEPHVHSHKACLDALKRCNIVILIVNNRYGGLYVNDIEHSITEMEYKSIKYNKEILNIPIINKKTWDELGNYLNKLNEYYKDNLNGDRKILKRKILKRKFREAYACEYVDNIKVLDFVRSIHKSNENNYLRFYNTSEEIIPIIQGGLEGFSRYYCEKIIEKQVKRVSDRKTSTGLLLSTNEIIDNKYYIEPCVNIISGTFNQYTTLEKQLIEVIKENNNVHLIGYTGTGKSTVLAKSFIGHYNSIKGESSYSLPFYLQLSGKGFDYSFSLSEYFQEAFNTDLQKDYYPFFKIEILKNLYFYIDSFDELGDILTNNKLINIATSELFDHPHILSCRSSYAYSYLNDLNFSNGFNIIMEIKKWDKPKIKEYITKFCDSRGHKGQINLLVNYLTKDEIYSMYNSPLLITMVLWIIEVNRMIIPSDLKSTWTLFDKCIVEISNRERARNQCYDLDSNKIIMFWSYVAWKMYHSRIIGKKIKMTDLLNDIDVTTYFGTGSVNEKLMHSIFEINVFGDVTGCVHEQFMEYFIARLIYYSNLSRKYIYPDYLEYAVKSEINSFFRSMYNDSSDLDKDAIINALRDEFNNCDCRTDNTSILRRAQILAHISRLGKEKTLLEIRELRKKEKNPIVYVSLCYGLVKRGDLEVEAELFKRMNEEPAIDSTARGFQLVYNGDKDIIAGSTDFRDCNNLDWKHTYASFERHLMSDEISYYFLRRLDLFAMTRFVLTRKDAQYINWSVIDNALTSKYDEDYKDYSKLIRMEYNKLKIAVSSIP